MKLAWAFALVLVGTLPPTAFASDLELILGRRAPQVDGSVKQFYSVKNNGHQMMDASYECGFVKGGDVVDATGGVISELKPGQTAYGWTLSSGAFDRADCRLYSVRPTEPE